MSKAFPCWLLKIYRCVYACPKRVAVFRIIDRLAVVLTAVVFAFSVYFAFDRGVIDGVKLIVLAAVPFVSVSAMRLIIKSPRPYQVVDFSEFSTTAPHYKLGSSFPSRHVFSAFLIAFLAFEYKWYLGVAALDFGMALAVLRVILGIHFPKDVICGAVIGIVSGIVGMLIL